MATSVQAAPQGRQIPLDNRSYINTTHGLEKGGQGATVTKIARTFRPGYSGCMRRMIVLVLLAAMSAVAQAPEGSRARAEELKRVLGLHLLAKESGYLGLIGESAQKVPYQGRTLAVQSQVYYMLTEDLPTNYLHWLAPDDTHILIEGGPVDYFIFHPDGKVEKVTLGRDVVHGERPVVAVPGNCWKALRLHQGTHYALMANALSPKWTPEGVTIGAGPKWVKRYSGAATWATPEFLRELIGPNWKPEE